MGIFTFWKRRRAKTPAEKQAKSRSKGIDLQIKEDSKFLKRMHDILLISIPEYEAAAFTLIKQMKLIHDGCALEDLADFRPVIWKILLENSRSFVQAIQTQNLRPAGSANIVHWNCEYIMSHRIDTDNPDFSFLPKFAEVVQDLWAEEIFPTWLDCPSHLPLDDNVEYFFAEAQRIVEDKYVPSIDDVLHASKNGIMETYFTMGQSSLRVLQVYGQRCARRKWIHLFADVTSIMFYASLSDYDEPGFAVRDQPTRLVESFNLFEAIVNSRWFSKTSIILFLTQLDEFRVKIHEAPLVEYFPEYTGGTDVNEGAEYILWRFIRSNHAQLNVYPHFTELEASNANSVLFVLIAVKETILINSLRDSGML
ncbi:G-protein alpha subunit [Russula compacta]|nr:G-protein alpha subunit [Russula compacta]